jgi:hypothetical protein
MCQDATAARDGGNFDESSHEEIYSFFLEDDDNDFMTDMLCMLCTLTNTAIGMSIGNHCLLDCNG